MTPEELNEAARTAQDMNAGYRHTVRVCTAAGCQSSGATDCQRALYERVQTGGEDCRVVGVGCMGLCAAGPLVRVNDDTLYGQVTPGDASRIIEALEGLPAIEGQIDGRQPFFARQRRVVLENCGTIDPESLDDYLAANGYAALATTVAEQSSARVIEEVTKSGLRGRGGAGYPTGLKWTTVAKAPGPKKYVICNADEGDPGAFMDRSVLEGDPHRVLEGMILAGYAVGAHQGYIYVRVEYPLAVERLTRAIKDARRAGILGHNVCGSDFSFQIELRLGAGAFVCGEETALMASVEGGRGTPRPRPPYPAEHGLFGHPTLINNVETFANIPAVVREGGAWFRGIGTPQSAGTKVFALAGRVKNTGLIEVPMGMTLREIIEDIGGGVPEGRALKAVQTGGPSGGCIPASHLDTPVDYERLRALGSIMGSGGMIVMDETSSMVDVARYFMEFSKSESCGKCIPCRVGTVQLHDMLQRLLNGQAPADTLDKLESLCEVVRVTSLCGLGQSAPNPIVSTLRFFREEYEALVAPEVQDG